MGVRVPPSARCAPRRGGRYGASVRAAELPTPCLLVDGDAFEHNVHTMAAALPGPRLRPHVKAFKSTALAHELVAAGHRTFCCATAREVLGMAAAGMGEDLLLANELVDPRRLTALGDLVRSGVARVTIAVDSDATIAAAAAGGIEEVLVDVDIGMPRCGCVPEDAGRVADAARAAGLRVRGVMGYEGHVVGEPDRVTRTATLEPALAKLQLAHELVGGDVISSGGTGTYDLNHLATEIQAGSYVLLDTHYARLGLPFRQGLALSVTVVSVSEGWAVGDGGLKALGMDHGDPDVERAQVFFCSDEHITFVPHADAPVVVGDKVLVRPAHIDPTIAQHEVLHVVRPADGSLLEGEVVDTWPVDLRNW